MTAATTLPTYNGYANKATWLVALWLDNEPYTSEELHRICNSGKGEYDASNQLREWVEEMVSEVTDSASLASDLLSWSLAYVEWREIVESHKEEEEEEEEEEEGCPFCMGEGVWKGQECIHCGGSGTREDAA